MQAKWTQQWKSWHTGFVWQLSLHPKDLWTATEQPLRAASPITPVSSGPPQDGSLHLLHAVGCAPSLLPGRSFHVRAPSVPSSRDLSSGVFLLFVPETLKRAGERSVGYTGHTCVSCPQNGRESESLRSSPMRLHMRPRPEAGCLHAVLLRAESESRAWGWGGQNTVFKLHLRNKGRSCSVFTSSSGALLHCLVCVGGRGGGCGADFRVSFAECRALAKFLLSCLTRHCFYKLSDGL